MNHEIANILKGLLVDLDFVDKISGLVQTVYMDVLDENKTRVQKSFPVSCDATYEDCIDGAYLDLCPDSSKKSVLYFEDGGVAFIDQKGKFKNYRSILRLICWLNVAKIKAEECDVSTVCSMNGSAIKSIICMFPKIPIDLGDIRRFYPEVVNEVIRDNSIFSKYTYNEKQTQYLMHPYDYFALTIETTFSICTADCSVSTNQVLPENVPENVLLDVQGDPLYDSLGDVILTP